MMRKTYVSFIFFMLVCSVFTVFLTSNICNASGTTLYVGGVGPGNYNKIQDAINNASSGDVVYVYSGTYYENDIIIDKSIELTGENKDTTIIDGSKEIDYKYDVIHIKADSVTISGFTIQQNNLVQGGATGRAAAIKMYSNYTTITGNIIQKSYEGIYYPYSGTNSKGDTILNNIIKNNDNYGIDIDSDDSEISGNDISNCVGGVDIFGSDNVISENTVHSTITGTGIYIGSDNNRVLNNIVEDCGYRGIDVQSGSKNINVSENIINGCGDFGLSLPSCNNATVSFNAISNCKEGISCTGSNQNTISNNNIQENDYGLYLYNANDNTIRDNNISNNRRYCGIDIWNSNNNVFYHNFFYNNIIHVLINDGSVNIWDNGYPSGGNTWDNYRAVDENNDGIGDRPYIINDNNQDRYPLGVFDAEPVADSNGPYSGYVGSTVNFDGSRSTDSDGTIVSYNWNFGDGSTGTGVRPNHVYLNAGNYSVILTVMDNDGGENEDSTVATINELPEGLNLPIADANGPYSGIVNVSLSFDGSGSTDSDGTIVSYNWNFGDESTGTGKSTNHIYSEAGSYTITLIVKDNDGLTNSNITTAEIRISGKENSPPNAEVNGPYSGNVNSTITFDGSGSFDSDGNIINYTWHFGDGTIGYGMSTIHTYTQVGNYTVTLTVADDNGSSTEDTTIVSITQGGKSNTPGFELIFVILTIALVLLWKRRRKL